MERGVRGKLSPRARKIGYCFQAGEQWRIIWHLDRQRPSKSTQNSGLMSRASKLSTPGSLHRPRKHCQKNRGMLEDTMLRRRSVCAIGVVSTRRTYNYHGRLEHRPVMVRFRGIFVEDGDTRIRRWLSIHSHEKEETLGLGTSSP